MKVLLITLLALTSFNTFSMNNEQALRLVKRSLRELKIHSKKTYCVKGTETCRIMVLLADKNTGKPANVFYDIFYSKERNVGSTCYFIPTERDPGQYHVLSELHARPEPNGGPLKKIDLISPKLAKIVISNDLKSAQFLNLKMTKVGTTQYVLASMIQTEKLVYIEGTNYDSNDSSVQQPIRVDYIRVR